MRQQQCNYFYPGVERPDQCPNPAYAVVCNEFGFEAPYCKEHIELFERQQRVKLRKTDTTAALPVSLQ